MTKEDAYKISSLRNTMAKKIGKVQSRFAKEYPCSNISDGCSYNPVYVWWLETTLARKLR